MHDRVEAIKLMADGSWGAMRRVDGIKRITYRFSFADGTTRTHLVELATPALDFVPTQTDAPPDWAALPFEQCPNCPLHTAEHAHCPVAVNLAPVIDAFQEHPSHQQVDVTVRTEQRDYSKRCALQVGLSSLVGLIMATSGCPILDRLRPMVHSHLPFATGRETMFRAIATYLLAQCVRQRRGLKPDWELRRLADTYDDIRQVNRAFAGRIRSQCTEDAGVNAVVILDAFAGVASLTLAKQRWEDIEPVFFVGDPDHSHTPGEPVGDVASHLH